MTQAEMEVEIKSLRGQIGQVQEQQEEQKKRWLWISRVSSGVVVVLAVAIVLLNLNSAGTPASMGFVITFMMLLFVFLTLSFGSVARQTNIGMKVHLRNFALWVVIVLLLLALFTLFQFRG